jgi:hypothetical protein
MDAQCLQLFNKKLIMIESVKRLGKVYHTLRITEPVESVAANQW